MYEILLPTLNFPLNVYAQALFLEQGSVEALHYGFWENASEATFNDKTACATAQKSAREVLFEHLPVAPAKLLEVDIGLGGTADVLSNFGYDYTGITPDNNQILYARHVLKPQKVKFVHCPFESVPTGVLYDVIVFQDSAQYIQAATLLGQCHSLLNAGGQVIIMDEIPVTRLANLDSALRQFGFELKKQLDFTDKAAPSIRYLQRTILKHRAAILYDLNITVTQLNHLMYSLNAREKEYAAGRYLYQFIQLQKV